MKIRARVACLAPSAATREIALHYYSRRLVNMSIMLHRSPVRHHPVPGKTFRDAISRKYVIRLRFCRGDSNHILRFFSSFFSIPLFNLLALPRIIIQMRSTIIPGRSNPVSFGFNINAVKRCNLVEIEFAQNNLYGWFSTNKRLIVF